MSEAKDMTPDAPPPKDPWPGDPTAPRLSLRQMSLFLMDIRGSGYMADGKTRVAEQGVWLTPADLDKLTQVIAALDYFELQREQAARSRK